MSTILMVHTNRLVSGVQYPGISSISAFLKRAGHKIILFDAAEYTPVLSEDPGSKENTPNQDVISLLFKEVPDSVTYKNTKKR